MELVYSYNLGACTGHFIGQMPFLSYNQQCHGTEGRTLTVSTQIKILQPLLPLLVLIYT